MTTYNWKFLRTDGGKITYALCIGDRMKREVEDLGIASAIEISGEYEISNSINDLLADSKLYFEAKQRGKYYQRKVQYTVSGPFKTLQRKLEKAELKAKGNP